MCDIMADQVADIGEGFPTFCFFTDIFSFRAMIQPRHMLGQVRCRLKFLPAPIFRADVPSNILVFGVLPVDMGLKISMGHTLVRTTRFFAGMLLNPGMPDPMCRTLVSGRRV